MTTHSHDTIENGAYLLLNNSTSSIDNDNKWGLPKGLLKQELAVMMRCTQGATERIYGFPRVPDSLVRNFASFFVSKGTSTHSCLLSRSKPHSSYEERTMILKDASKELNPYRRGWPKPVKGGRSRNRLEQVQVVLKNTLQRTRTEECGWSQYEYPIQRLSKILTNILSRTLNCRQEISMPWILTLWWTLTHLLTHLTHTQTHTRRKLGWTDLIEA